MSAVTIYSMRLIEVQGLPTSALFHTALYLRRSSYRECELTSLYIPMACTVVIALQVWCLSLTTGQYRPIAVALIFIIGGIQILILLLIVTPVHIILYSIVHVVL